MKSIYFGKVLACAVIFLFIGISAAPAVTLQIRTANPVLIEAPRVNATQNNGLVGITVQFCKPEGLENHTVWLTKEKASQLDTLIANFKMNLDSAKTLNETVAIYNDMIVSLDELGLIPNDMSVEQAKQLVTGGGIAQGAPEIKKLFTTTKDQLNKAQTQKEKAAILNNSMASLNTIGLLPQGMSIGDAQKLLIPDMMQEYKNWFCFVSGETTNTRFGLFRIGLGYDGTQYFPWDDTGAQVNVPAEGWIQTNGLMGNIRWEGAFYGNCHSSILGGSKNIGHAEFYVVYPVGVSGFIGMKMETGTDQFFYSGFARKVDLIR